MENVKNVLITAEVAKLLDYDPVYIIRIAKELLAQGILTENDFRNAGPRTYLFNEEAIKQLRIRFDIPTYFLTYRMGEESCEVYEIHEVPYSELKVVCDDLIILQSEEEKKQFIKLNAAFHHQEDEDGLYEAYIQEKESLHEYVSSDDAYGWISYNTLTQAIREGKAYFVKELDLIKVKSTDLARLNVMCEEGFISEVLEKVSGTIFKSHGGDYYRSINSGSEVELIDPDDERMKYWLMSEEDVMDQIAKDFELDIDFEKVGYWDNQPVFVTKSGNRINVNELKIKGNAAYLQVRNLSKILDEIMMLN